MNRITRLPYTWVQTSLLMLFLCISHASITNIKPDLVEPFSLRINSGGPSLILNSKEFVADSYFNGPSKSYTNPAVTTISNTTIDALYLTERSTLSGENAFNYAIPVPNGNYKVTLHFAEIYWGATNGGPGGKNRRVFNVAFEEEPLITRLDINEESGSMTALTKVITLQVEDGTLNLDFNATKDQPKISALEIEQVLPTSSIYINSGGPEIELEGKVFQEDAFFKSGRSFTNYGISEVKNTSLDELYKSERSTGTGGGGFSYEIPLTSGKYQVKVHFAEIYWGATGGGPGGSNKRLINLKLEGEELLSTLDIYKNVGPEAALVKNYTVDVHDGILNLDFSSAKDEPKVAAIEVSEYQAEETVIARINAGSSSVNSDGKDFTADQYFTGNTSTHHAAQIIDIKNTTSDEIYKTERSAAVDNGSFGYAIPVDNGSYKVNLHFAEIWFGATGGAPGGTNKRKFDVALEGRKVLSNFDLTKEVGTMTAEIKSYETKVTDGILNIDFTAQINRPQLAALEIFQKNAIDEEDQLPLIASFNTGGPALSLDGTEFQEDAYFSNSQKTGGTSFNEIEGTNLDEIYKTERSADNNQGAFSYDFPVTNGTYQVKLHFAEIYFGSPGGGQGGTGKRVFDVNIEGDNSLVDFDITEEAGGAGTALVKTFEVNVGDGVLNLDFTASIDRPQICAIQLYGNGELGDEPVDPCSWTEGADSSLEKLESQSAKIDDKLYTFAGFLNGFLITAVTEIYDTTNDSWYKGAPMPTPVTHMGISVINDDIWIIGGFIGDNPGVATDLIQIYNTTTDTWREGPRLPYRRGSGAAAVHEGKIHFFGGLLPDRKTDVDDHYVLDTENLSAGWVAAAPLPYGRNHLSAATVDGIIYAIGGQYDHDNYNSIDYLRYMHAYDPKTDTWTRKADLPSDRSHFEPGTIVHNGKIIIVGGRRGWFFFKDITEYDPATDTWKELCELPEPLLAPSAKVFGDRLIVANGGNGETDLRATVRWIPIQPEENLSAGTSASLTNAKNIENSIVAYPNPTDGLITLRGLELLDSEVHISINSIGGASLIQKTINASSLKSNYSIDAGSLQSGIYFIDITTSSNMRKVIKFIKK